MQHGYEVAGRPWGRLAEALVRTGGDGVMEWLDMRLTTHFQPIFCVRRGECHGYEALVRATDRAGNALRPDQVFEATPATERVLLDWTLRALHLRNFARVDPGNRMLFLNVHPEAAVNDADAGRGLADLIRYYGLVPKRVCVEILEGECTDESLLRRAVGDYRALGIAIAMDHFGAGRSNLDRVVRLRPGIVKIERSLLADAAIGRVEASRMLAVVVALVHEANARVALEGIENADEARIAIEMKADYLQGFHFSMPQAGIPEGEGETQLGEVLLRRGAPRLAIA